MQQMTDQSRPALAKALTLMLSVCAAGTANAQQTDSEAAAPLEMQQLDFGVTTGAIWSDNILLLPAEERNGTIGELGVDLMYNQESRRLRSDIDVNAAYQHYFDDEFDNDVIGGVDGTIVFGVIPERLEWVLQENFGQTRVAVLAADTPANRESINYLTTGPDLTLRFGSITSARFSGRYSRTDYEEADLDGDRTSAAAALIRQLSRASSLSLNAVGERLEYDDAVLNPDYDRQHAFVRYELSDARTDLGIDLGYTQIDRDEEKKDGELVRVSLRRQVSPASSIHLKLESEFTDAGDVFRSTQHLNGVSRDAEAVLATADVLERRLAYLGWAFRRNRTSFGFNGEYSEENYEKAVELDRSLVRYGAYFGRQLTAQLQLSIDAQLITEDFDTSDISIDNWQGIAALDWMLGRTVSLRLQLDVRDHHGSGGVVQKYQENRVSVFLHWSPRGRRSPR